MRTGPRIFSGNRRSYSRATRSSRGNALEAGVQSSRRSLLKDVVEVQYTTGKSSKTTRLEVVGDVHGVRSTKRKRILSSSQRATRWEGAAIAPGTIGGARADYGTRGAGSVEETSFRGTELASNPRAGERAGGFGEPEFTRGAETRRKFAELEPGFGGLVSADTPNFGIARCGKGTAGTVATAAVYVASETGAV